MTRLPPIPTERIVLHSHPDTSTEDQLLLNASIVTRAREVAKPGDTLVGLEVWYLVQDRESSQVISASTQYDFDAVIVDVVKGEIVGVYPPYAQIGADEL